jgi:cytochrome P450
MTDQNHSHPILEFMLPVTQRQIIDRAAGRISKQNRQAFRKYVEDILRARRDPPDDTDIRHACGSGFVRYGRKI